MLTAVVASKSDQHHTGLWNGALDLEVVDGLLWCSDILAVLLGNQSGLVVVARLDLSWGVLDVWAVDDKSLLAGSGGSGSAVGVVCVRSHCGGFKLTDGLKRCREVCFLLFR